MVIQKSAKVFSNLPYRHRTAGEQLMKLSC